MSYGDNIYINYFIKKPSRTSREISAAMSGKSIVQETNLTKQQEEDQDIIKEIVNILQFLPNSFVWHFLFQNSIFLVCSALVMAFHSIKYTFMCCAQELKCSSMVCQECLVYRSSRICRLGVLGNSIFNFLLTKYFLCCFCFRSSVLWVNLLTRLKTWIIVRSWRNCGCVKAILRCAVDQM